MSDLSSVETPALLSRVETLAAADPKRESEERWAIVTELHRRGGAAVYQSATAWCASPAPLLRCLGADVLGQLGFGEGHPFAGVSTPTLMRLLDDPEGQVVVSALVALGHLKSGELTTICALVSHPSADVRHHVAFCIGGRDEERALRTLLRLSRDDDAHVRDWATFALGTLSSADTPDLRDALVERLSDGDADVRGEAMRGLASRKDMRAASAILAELQMPEGSDLAVEAACEMPRDRFLPLLEEILASNPDAEHVRSALDLASSDADE